MRHLALLLLLVPALMPALASAQTDAELLAAARAFPAMPQSTVQLSVLLGRPATFGSGTPFNDIEFTIYDTDYIDGENSGYDVFLPVDPSAPWPGSDQIKYLKTVLNTDLDATYGAARGDRIILGTAEAARPFFLRGPDGVDNDYAVIQHVDYRAGHLQIAGSPSQYRLLTASTADGAPDLVAFVFPCDALVPPLSGAPPQNPTALCNASRQFRLDDSAQVRFAAPRSTATAVAGAIAQVGGPGREIVSNVTVDATGHVYLYGSVDGRDTAPGTRGNDVFVTRIAPSGATLWTTRLALPDGSLLKDAVADAEHLYVAGRTQGALPGHPPGGSWDGILLKMRQSDGAVVATDQYGSAGIDGYGNVTLDDAGGLYVSAQGAAPDAPGGLDRDYLVARYDAATLALSWRVLDVPSSTTLASAEAWGGLTYVPGATPGGGRLVVAGWFFARGANAFVAVYEDLLAPAPTRAAVRTLGTAAATPTADWVLDNAVGPDGTLYVGGYTTGSLDGQPARGEGDAFVMALDPVTLATLRTVQFGTPRSEFVRKLAVGPDGSLYAVGTTHGDLFGPGADPAGTSGDVFAVRLSPTLDVLASTQVGTPHEDRAGAAFHDGRLYVGGTTEGSLAGPSGGSFDGFALALDATTLAVTPPTVASEAAPGAGAARLAVAPNPSSGGARVSLDVPAAGTVRAAVHDVLGRSVATLWSGPLPAGEHTATVPATLAPGAYVVRATGDGWATTARLIVAR